MISGPGWRLAVEAETVLTDIQALERRLTLKLRDGEVDHVLLLVADTPRNRRARAAAPASLTALTANSRHVLAALRRGRNPGASALIFR
jgi:predicted metalloenzyme YecM